MNEGFVLLLIHKGNSSAFTDSYNSIFRSILENNPCVSSNALISRKRNCSTLMGGVFKYGASVTGLVYNELGLSIFHDFEKTEGTKEDIARFANDQRLVDLAMLNLELLGPSLDVLMNYILDTLPEELQDSIVLTILLLTVYVGIFLATTISWIVWLLRFMKGTIYDTKSLLSNLPDDIIVKNDEIYKYLSDASESI